MSSATELQGDLYPSAARAPSAERTLVEIHGGPGHASLESLRELARFRDVLGAFVRRQIKVKYKQAVIGIGWAVLQPVAGALLFALFLGHFAQIGSEGVPYILFALAGTVAWSYFSTAAGNSMESLVVDQTLLRKVYFPREVLPIASVLSALVDFVPGLATVAVAAAIEGVGPSVVWLALPLPLLLLALTALGLGLALSSINVYYRDVRYALPFLLQLGLFASPVVFSLAVVPGRWRTIYTTLNPVAAAIDDLRRIMVHQTWPDLKLTGLALAWSLVLVAGGYILFKRLERGFSDRI